MSNKKKNNQDPDDAARGGCVLPGCIDLFILPIQIGILGYHFQQLI